MISQDKEEIYQRYLTQEENKQVVHQFYKNLNNEEWDEIIPLFHDDFFIPVSDFINPEITKLRIRNIEFARSYYDDNHKILSDFGKERGMSYNWPPTNKKEMLDIMKLEAEFEKVSIEVFNMYTEGDIVFVTRSYNLTEVNTQVSTNQIVHDRFLLHEGKIRQTESYHDYLAVLIQVGKIVYNEKDDIKVQKYLDNLRKLGILED